MKRGQKYFCLLAVLAISGAGWQKAAEASGQYKIIRIAILRIRTAPKMDAGLREHRLKWGDKLVVECQELGGKGGKSNVWNKISSPVSGWIPDWYTNTGGDGGFAKNIPRCSSLQPPNSPENQAAAWARAQIGRTRQPNGLPWALWCDRFVANAYGRPFSGYWNASAHYADLYRRRLIRRSPPSPPAGTMVFYQSRYGGHVAISLGRGQIITSPTPPRRAVYQTGLSAFPGYLGWSYANPEWIRR